MYRFSIKKDSATFYYVDAYGAVQTTIIPTYLPEAPRGWENINVEHNRSMKYLGIFRSIATPIDFVLTGRTIIRHILYTQGVQGVAIIYIERQSDVDYSWNYFYEGLADFETALDHDFYITVNLIEGGVKKILDDNEDKEYQIVIDPADPLLKHAFIDGVTMVDNAKWWPVLDSALINKMGYLMPNTVNSDYAGDFKGGIAKDQVHGVLQKYKVGEVLQSEFYDLYFYAAAGSQDVIFSIVSSFTHIIQNTVSPTTPPNVDVRLLVVQKDKTIRISEILGSYPNPVYAGLYSRLLNKTTNQIHLNQDERLYLIYGFDSANANDTLTVTVNQNAIDTYTYYHSLNVVFKFASNNVAGFLYKDYADKLAKTMSDGQYGLISNFLSNTALTTYDLKPYYQIVTSGDGLRQIANAKIKGSLTNLFKDANGVFSMGLGIEGNNFRLEPLDYFFDTTHLIADLGSVSDLIMEVAKEFTYNVLKIGYTDEDYEIPNGKDEYFGTYQWELPTKNVKKEWDQVSPYKSAVMAVEKARYNQGKPSEDGKSDNDIFVLLIDPSLTGGPNNYPILYRPDLSTYAGLPFPESWYNRGRSPKRNLLRHGRFIRGFCAFLDAEYVKFLTSQKNQSVITKGGTPNQIAETDNVQVGSLGSKLFHPIVFKFKCVPPIDLSDRMKANPNGYFSFMWNGVSYQGFPMSVGINLSIYSSSDFTLLAVPSTIISNLKE